MTDTAFVMVCVSFTFCVAMICYTIILVKIGSSPRRKNSSSPGAKSIAELMLQKREGLLFKSHKTKKTPVDIESEGER